MMSQEVLENSSVLRKKQSAALFASIMLCWIVLAAILTVFQAGRFNKPDIVIYDKINPSVASLESLVRLPGVGPAVGSAIIEYRQNAGEGKEAFTKPSDLQGVHGIGPKTVEKIKLWLCFDNGD